MSSPWNDLRRPPLRAEVLQRDLDQEGWQVRLFDEVESTQIEAMAAARSGAPAFTVIIAEHQRAGRGRRDRIWVSPARAGITMSLIFRPETVSPWLGIAVAAGAAEGLGDVADVDIALKWPNDLLLHERKCGGVIAEVNDGVVIVGLGLNISTESSELPVESATSLALEGVHIDREVATKAVLRAIKRAVDRDPAQLRSDYLGRLSTLGRQVRVITAAGSFEGRAESIDDQGQLIVGGRSFAVGDVIHLR